MPAAKTNHRLHLVVWRCWQGLLSQFQTVISPIIPNQSTRLGRICSLAISMIMSLLFFLHLFYTVLTKSIQKHDGQYKVCRLCCRVNQLPRKRLDHDVFLNFRCHHPVHCHHQLRHSSWAWSYHADVLLGLKDGRDLTLLIPLLPQSALLDFL